MPEDKCFDLIVIGGGASGMSASIAYQQAVSEASGSLSNVLIIEKNDRVGKKVLATGNGRCNLSNRDMSILHFHSHRQDFPDEVLKRVGQLDTLSFMENLGVLTVAEGDKLFPMSKQASSVVDAFRFALSEYQIEVALSAQVDDIRFVEAVGSKKLFRISLVDGRRYFGNRVIVACGGACAPSLGTTGDGYRLLSSLGHKVYAPKPSIVQILTDTSSTRVLDGQRIECELTLTCDSQVVATQFGEVLFTDYGISGPAAFQVSGEVARRVRKGQLSVPVQISLCLFDKETIVTLKEELIRRINELSDRPVEQLLLAILPAKIASTVLKCALNRPLSLPISSISINDVDRILSVMQAWTFKVTGTRSLEYAQTTIGGASCDEFQFETMESLLVPGLYGCGEVLDVDGDCGGYNLQWAFSSGILAGRSAARSFLEGIHAN